MYIINANPIANNVQTISVRSIPPSIPDKIAVKALLFKSDFSKAGKMWFIERIRDKNTPPANEMNICL